MLEAIEKEPAADHDALRERAKAEMKSASLSQRAAAEEAGVAYSTYSAWLNGTYSGRNEDVARDVARWLDSRVARARSVMNLPAPPDFVMTPTARDIIDRLTFAQAASDFGVIVGAAGIGKTTAITRYRQMASNVWTMTADQSCKSAHGMLAILADEMGIAERRALWLSRAIATRVRATSALIIIDEAQHLTTEALDQLRAIPDAARCGVVVAGNESLLARLKGGKGANAAHYAQLISRVGTRFVGTSAKARDIDMLLEAWGITDAGTAKVLRRIARKAGALRLLTKTIRVASMYAAGDGSGAISEAHIRQAWAQLSSSSIESDA